MAEGKISVYSVPDLKNTTDDALPNYLSSLKFKPQYQLQDVKLVLGYTAVIISAALFYADWKLGWDQTKPYTLPAVVVYFILNSAFTYWIYFVEKGTIFVGEKDGSKITISTHADKYDPTYKLTIQTTSIKNPSSTPKKQEVSAPFSRWFTSDGEFVAKPFQQWLASEIPVIGKADPTNVVEEIGRGSETQPSNIKSANVRIDDLQGVLAHLQNQGGAARKR